MGSPRSDHVPPRPISLLQLQDAWAGLGVGPLRAPLMPGIADKPSTAKSGEAYAVHPETAAKTDKSAKCFTSLNPSNPFFFF